MKFVLTIDSENDACQTREDLVDLLDIYEGKIRDYNGNTVGKWSLSGDDPPDSSDSIPESQRNLCPA